MIEISVIIPVYNVEEYIGRTIESALQQSYKNYEVILVDDGSSDRSGDICKSYADTYDNVFYFRKENGGLSDARNYGVSKSHFEWVFFLDGDDYIEEYTIELLSKLHKNFDADLISTKLVSTKSEILHKNTLPEDFLLNASLINKIDFLEEMYRNRKTTVSVCGKLFKKQLVVENPFTVGILYEDLDVMVKYVSLSKKIVICDAVTYHYYQRPNSIVNSRFHVKQLDFFRAIDKNVQYVDEYFNSQKELKSLIVTKCIDGGWKLINNVIPTEETLPILQDIQKRYKCYIFDYLFKKNILKHKVMLLLFIASPEIYFYIRKLIN